MSDAVLKATAVAVGVGLGCWPRSAVAVEGSAHATTDIQFYSVASPSGNPQLLRRRYTQTLGLDLNRIEGTSRLGRFTFRSLLRMDTDFGVSAAERDLRNLPAAVPTLIASPLDLMYAYLDGDRVAGTPVGFRLGRQYQVDALGWWSFDGLTLRMGDPRLLRVEAYSGFEQRAALPMLSLSRYSSDGVMRGSRRDLESNVWPSLLNESHLAPALGVAAETIQLPYLHARISYRRVVQRDAVYLSPFQNANGSYDIYRDQRVSSEKAGASLNLTLEDWGAVDLNAVYDLVAGLCSSADAAVDWFVHRNATVGVEVQRYVPTFDADSIFNYFVHQGTTSYRARADWNLNRRWELASSFGVRQFSLETPLSGGTAGLALDALGELFAIRRWPGGNLKVSGFGEAGDTGRRWGSDLTVRQAFRSGFYDTLALLSLWDWHDRLRPGRDATSVGYVLGGGLNPSSLSRLGVEWEHSSNALVGQRFRLLLTLALRVSL